jgi:hypothetical protein
VTEAGDADPFMSRVLDISKAATGASAIAVESLAAIRVFEDRTNVFRAGQGVEVFNDAIDEWVYATVIVPLKCTVAMYTASGFVKDMTFARLRPLKWCGTIWQYRSRPSAEQPRFAVIHSVYDDNSVFKVNTLDGYCDAVNASMAGIAQAPTPRPPYEVFWAYRGPEEGADLASRSYYRCSHERGFHT